MTALVLLGSSILRADTMTPNLNLFNFTVSPYDVWGSSVNYNTNQIDSQVIHGALITGQCVQSLGGTLVGASGSACNIAAGIAAPQAWYNGTVLVSSPTSTIIVSSGNLTAAFITGATVQISLNPSIGISTITASSGTITTLYNTTLTSSSGTVSKLISSTATITALTVSSGTISTLTAPIINGSSSVLVAAQYTGQVIGAIDGSGTQFTINYPNKIFDTHNAYNASTYTVPTSGYYYVTASVNVSGNGTAGNLVGIEVYQNSTVRCENFTRVDATLSSSNWMIEVPCIINAAPSDQIIIKSENTLGGTPTYTNSVEREIFNILRLNN